jgi:hypothetical protein
MKKMFLSSILTVLIAASSFAGDVNRVNSKVVSNFLLEFENAKNVSWTSTENYVKASYILNNQSMNAYYDFDGNWIGTATHVAIDELPLKTKRFFGKKYADYIVKEAIEFNGIEEKAYYIAAESDTKSVIVKVSAEGTCSVFKEVIK